jgi:hypothetical protein
MNAPPVAAKKEGNPNSNNTRLLMCLAVMMNLKILLKKCTKAVDAIAISIGKKMANTGVSNVPNPNPEKKVSNDAAKAMMQGRMYIIIRRLKLSR